MQFSMSLKRSRGAFTRVAAIVLLGAVATMPAFADSPSPANSPSAVATPAVPAAGGGNPATQAPAIPAGARVRFHLTQPLGSNLNKAGDTFSFVLLDPVAVEGRIVVAEGALGSGTVLVAGKSGTSGHEGDLTLRLDSVSAPNKNAVVFSDQRIAINGRNRKVMSGVLGFVPFAGLGAIFIHGAEIHIDTDTPIETILAHPALMTTTTSAVTPAS